MATRFEKDLFKACSEMVTRVQPHKTHQTMVPRIAIIDARDRGVTVFDTVRLGCVDGIPDIHF